MKILNPPLYNALYEKFNGNVAITNEGNEGDVRISTKGVVEKVDGGEEYRINCPECGDTRKRLYISHFCYKNTVVDGKKVKTDHLFHCHNEKCHNSELKNELAIIVKDRPSRSVQKSTEKKERKIISLPENAVPINSEDAPIQAREYLISRGFNLNELYTRWDVRAVDVLEQYPGYGPKIIYPVYWQGELNFWQARLCFNPTKEQTHAGVSKYYISPGASKSDILYNRNMAAEGRVVVICEGVTDVHRIGPCAVAGFGKTLSTRQIQIMKNSLGDSMGVILFDSDARKEVDEFYEKYREGLFSEGLYPIYLESGDPADYTRKEIWNIICTQITKQKENINEKKDN